QMAQMLPNRKKMARSLHKHGNGSHGKAQLGRMMSKRASRRSHPLASTSPRCRAPTSPVTVSPSNVGNLRTGANFASAPPSRRAEEGSTAALRFCYVRPCAASSPPSSCSPLRPRMPTTRCDASCAPGTPASTASPPTRAPSRRRTADVACETALRAPGGTLDRVVAQADAASRAPCTTADADALGYVGGLSDLGLRTRQACGDFAEDLLSIGYAAGSGASTGPLLRCQRAVAARLRRLRGRVIAAFGPGCFVPALA